MEAREFANQIITDYVAFSANCITSRFLTIVSDDSNTKIRNIKHNDDSAPNKDNLQKSLTTFHMILLKMVLFLMCFTSVFCGEYLFENKNKNIMFLLRG